ncbi:gliding motility-associated C-terminal domain-containing protein [Flavobacterium sp. DGU11]|uniref:Gliding motility-associated C-terminal domain-containing protein n=1 Tax=Flavobacterium arundinis TaxID=3139143 RepID=A0ABU9HX54_9FLAO
MRKENKLYYFGIMTILIYILGMGASYAQCPVITSFTPASGPANTVVTVTGSNFQSGSGITSAQINGVTVPVFSVISDTEAQITVPATATNGTVTLASAACSGTSGSSFTVLTSDCNAVGPTEIYISELYDHTPLSYGMIELYNPTNSTITFNGQYVLERYGTWNDGSPTNSSYILTLPGSIAPHSTYLVESSQNNDPGCSNVPNASFGSGINADDGIKLKKNSIVIDFARAPDYTGYTVIRKPDAVAPQANNNLADWNTTSSFNCANLGIHNTNMVAPSTITAQPQDETSCEDGQAQFSVVISNTIGFSYQWKMLNAAGAWVNVTNGGNYSGATTATLTVDPASLAMDGTQYYCQITSTGCTLLTNAAELVITPEPVVTIAITEPTCTTPTGSITITPVVGEGLTYQINGGPFQTSATFAGLDPGDYILTIQGPGGCPPVNLDVTIGGTPTAPAVATVITVQPTCATPTGTITVTAPTGTEYTYSINNGPFQPETAFDELDPGTYTITVKNAGGCTSVTGNITINAVPAGPAVATVTTVDPTCTTPTGAITVTAPTGAGFTYNLNGGPFQAETLFDGLTPGTYSITVKNADGCTSVHNNIVINPAPNAPAQAVTTTVQPTCSIPTGSITVTAPTDPGLTYSLNGGPFQTETLFDGLDPGTYTITVKNADGCTSVSSNIFINPAPVVPDAATVTTTQPACTTPTGSITITAPIGAFTYSLNGSPFQTETLFDELAPGTYTVTVKNADGCTSVSNNIVINTVPNAPAPATATTIQPTCITVKGSITVTAPTGAGLTYSLNGGPFQPETLFDTLDPGTYVITVKNADGCTSVSNSIIISPVPNAPAAAATTTVQPICSNPFGSITVTAPIGGVTYSLNGGAFQPETTFANLVPGNYTITVKNTDGCTSVSNTIFINAVPNAPDMATATTVQPTCLATTGSITITAPTGAGYTYSLNGGTFQPETTFSTLDPGTYTITVKNADGCTSVSNNIIIDAVPNAPTTATTTTSQPSCIVPTGTITVTSPTEAGMTYSLNGGAFVTNTTFAGLAPANYTITVKNADGCTSVSAPITISPLPAGPQVTGTQGCRDTTFGRNYVLEGLPLDNSFDVATADFEWRNEQGVVVGNNENTFNVSQYVDANGIDAADFPLQFGLTVTTAAGCESTYTFTVEASFCTIPRGISPNNDTKNDNFDIAGLHARRLAIFNRYGKEVYSRNDYKDEWYGQTDNGDELPTGTYYYVIDTPSESYTGWVYINRQMN